MEEGDLPVVNGAEAPDDNEEFDAALELAQIEADWLNDPNNPNRVAEWDLSPAEQAEIDRSIREEIAAARGVDVDELVGTGGVTRDAMTGRFMWEDFDDWLPGRDFSTPRRGTMGRFSDRWKYY